MLFNNLKRENLASMAGDDRIIVVRNQESPTVERAVTCAPLRHFLLKNVRRGSCRLYASIPGTEESVSEFWDRGKLAELVFKYRLVRRRMLTNQSH